MSRCEKAQRIAKGYGDSFRAGLFEPPDKVLVKGLVVAHVHIAHDPHLGQPAFRHLNGQKIIYNLLKNLLLGRSLPKGGKQSLLCFLSQPVRGSGGFFPRPDLMRHLLHQP